MKARNTDNEATPEMSRLTRLVRWMTAWAWSKEIATHEAWPSAMASIANAYDETWEPEPGTALARFHKELKEAAAQLPLIANEGDEMRIGGRLFKVTAFKNAQHDQFLQWELCIPEGKSAGVVFNNWPRRQWLQAV